MRDFRDAKAIAHTLRAALATKGLNITVSQSLELIAEAFGAADWNTLSAAIRGEAAGSRNNAHSPQFPATATMRALAYARQRKAPVCDAGASPARADRRPRRFRGDESLQSRSWRAKGEAHQLYRH